MLYDRTLFLHWVGDLVGLDYKAERRLALSDDHDVPVVLVTGEHGSGRTAVLDALAERYRNRVPFGYLDLSRHRFAESMPAAVQGDTFATGSPLVRLLDGVAWDMTREPRDTGTLELPRLMVAMIVISLWPPGKPLNRLEAEQFVGRANDQVDARTRQRRQRLVHYGAALLENVAQVAFPGLPAAVDSIIGDAARLFMDELLTHHQRSKVRTWWKRCRPESDSAEANLLDVAKDFHSGEGWRERAESDLVGALLADLTAGFGPQHRLRRRPLLLIDNLDKDPAGPQLLDLILANRRNLPDPLVVVATTSRRQARHWPAARPAPVEQVPGLLAEPVLEARLSPLGWPDDTLGIIDHRYRGSEEATLRFRERLGATPRLIHRLTGGLALGVCTMADAVVRWSDDAKPFDPSTLLGLRVVPKPDEPVTVVDHLLPLLVPDDGVRDDLVLFSAAADRAAALALADRFLGGFPAQVVGRAETFLRDETRPVPGSGFFIGDMLLRSLLLHRLRTREPADGPGWDAVHGFLHAHYAAATVGADGTGPLGPDEPLRLRHAMSLGRESQTAGRLLAAFADSGQRAWLAALTCVAAAPYGGKPEHRVPSSADKTAIRDAPTDPDALHNANARLLRASWYLSDPLTPPDHSTVDRLVEDLGILGGKHASDGQVFHNVANRWKRALKDPDHADEPWQATGWPGTESEG